MAIHAAPKTTAANNVEKTVSDILGWARYPDASSITGEWWDAYKAQVTSVTESALRSFAGDDVICQKLRKCRSLCFELLGRLFHSETLKTIPVEQWTVKADVQLCDDIAAMAREFRIVAWGVELPTEEEPDSSIRSTLEVNVWKQARDQNSKITISDQMLTLYKDDDSIVDRKNLSAEVARVLACSPQAVRRSDNAAWKFYRTEQARRKKIRQDLKARRWTDSEQNDASQ
jgi:hypothetical protein